MVEIDTIYDWDRNEHNFQNLQTKVSVYLVTNIRTQLCIYKQTHTNKISVIFKIYNKHSCPIGNPFVGGGGIYR